MRPTALWVRAIILILTVYWLCITIRELAPFKALAMEEGVNYTAGLPVVRTSPAHGTAYDIAGKGVACEDSFRQAIPMLPSMCSVTVSGKKWLVPIRCVNSITRNVTIVIN